MKTKTIEQVIAKQRLRKAKTEFKQESSNKPRLVYSSSGKHFQTNDQSLQA